ncbi:MAG: DUF6198 family protein [Eubacteriales bacterium]
MTSKENMGVRMLFYLGGLIIMTLGVAFSVKSDLGVSPISSIPYTITCVTGMDLGAATIVFSIFMVILQIIILRKQFKMINLLQLPIGILFGLFLSFCCGLMVYLPEPSGMIMKFVLMLISTFIVALGVFVYVAAGFVPLAPEGAMLAICKMTKFKFPNVKLCSDITMVVVSGITCLVVIKELGSVGIGTIIAAVLVGNEVKLMTKFFGKRIDKLLGVNFDADCEKKDDNLHAIKKTNQ